MTIRIGIIGAGHQGLGILQVLRKFSDFDVVAVADKDPAALDRAKKFVKIWSEKGLATKNLPDAVNWHFAGTWGHIFSQYDEYKGKDLTEAWKQSDEILRRAIAISIFVNMDESQINKIIGTVSECLQRI